MALGYSTSGATSPKVPEHRLRRKTGERSSLTRCRVTEVQLIAGAGSQTEE